MRRFPTSSPSHPRGDRADVAALRTASGADVEVMRTSYVTQVFPRHAHDYFTVGVMLRGAGVLWHRGENAVTRAGDVIVIPPGEVHTGGVARCTGVLSYLAVHVPPEMLAACAEAQGLRGGRAPAFAGMIIRDALVGEALRRLDAEVSTVHAERAAMDGGSADAALSDALGLLVRRHAERASSAEGSAPDREPAVVRIAREIIDDCYDDNTETSLRALALHAGVTPFHLVRLFTLATGLSPHRYLVQTRVKRASELLARGISPSFVAAMTGFADQSHLTAQFKRYVGTTPASYQRSLAPLPRPES